VLLERFRQRALERFNGSRVTRMGRFVFVERAAQVLNVELRLRFGVETLDQLLQRRFFSNDNGLLYHC